MGGPGRDERVDALLADAVADADGAGLVAGARWLVTDGLPRAAAALAACGAAVVPWRRFAGPDGPGCPEPPDGPFAGAVVRPWRGADAARMHLHLVAARLAPGGVVWAAASNDEGGRSLGDKLRELLAEVDGAVPGRKARRYLGRHPVSPRGALDDWREEVVVSLGASPRSFASWPGLFAHGRLDPGTALLLEHLPDPAGARVLDFGCGIGPIAAALAGRGARLLEACDHDALAVHAARENVPEAGAHCVDGVPAGGPWDLVVSNPPIHRGSDRDLSVLGRLFAALRERLAPGGEVRWVAQSTVPVPALAEALGPVRRVATDRRYTVWGLRKAR